MPPKQKGIRRSSKPPADLLDAVKWWGDFQPGGNMASVNPQPRVVTYENDAREAFEAFDAFADSLAVLDLIALSWSNRSGRGFSAPGSK